MSTSPCTICAAQSRIRGGSAFYDTRGLDWPTVEVGGLAVHKACQHEAERVLTFPQEAYLDTAAGAYRWHTNNAVAPVDCLQMAVVFGVADAQYLASHEAARKAEEAEVLARYAAWRRATPYSAEELSEMRNAFGPGAEVVNAITGQRITL